MGKEPLDYVVDALNEGCFVALSASSAEFFEGIGKENVTTFAEVLGYPRDTKFTEETWKSLTAKDANGETPLSKKGLMRTRSSIMFAKDSKPKKVRLTF